MRPRCAANEAGGRPGDVNRRDEAESGTSGGRRRAPPFPCPGALARCRRRGGARPALAARLRTADPGATGRRSCREAEGSGSAAPGAAAGTRGTIAAEGSPPLPVTSITQVKFYKYKPTIQIKGFERNRLPQPTARRATPTVKCSHPFVLALSCYTHFTAQTVSLERRGGHYLH